MYAAFKNADNLIMKKYLHNLSEMAIVNADNVIKELKTGSNVNLFEIQRIVYNKNENNIDKLTTVYNSLSYCKDVSIVVLIDGKKDRVNIYMGTVTRKLNIEEKKGDTVTGGRLLKTLQTAFESNFKGSEICTDIQCEKRTDGKPNINNEDILKSVFENKNAVSAVNSVPAIRNKNNAENDKFIQGIERFIDSMIGKEYAVIFLADVVDSNQIAEMCARYEDLYSQLYPFLKSEQTLNKSMQEGNVKSFVTGTTNTINESVSKSSGTTVTEGTFSSHSVGGSAGINAGVLNAGVNYNYTKGKNKDEGKSESETETNGTAKSLTEQNSLAESLSSGSGESLQISFENRGVKNLLDRIDEQIKRLRSLEDVGAFECGIYFLAEDSAVSRAAAAKYQALIRGANSSVEGSAINTWESENNKDKPPGETSVFEQCVMYLEKLYHPIFLVNERLAQKSEKSREAQINRAHRAPTNIISGKELAICMGLPTKSGPGIPVTSCAEFGRNVESTDEDYVNDLEIGKVYHMNSKEDSVVKISANDLTAHTFITGSTGVGKSNTIYGLLKTLKDKKDVKFMVVEPAKGEYKDVLGTDKDVSVYGTNPKVMPLLRINPFEFPEGVHIYEHMDRLVEIFNVCWPMYAAMPAVLKAAMENAYIATGWDLKLSENTKGMDIYPTFDTVAREVRKYINESEYSDENKSNYKGSLLTRLESLTNGINSMIFTSNALRDKELFDENVIVDLSKVGSTETKSLIMGILVMKLQEYRSCSGERNSKLKHVTVLEEAHNLLKRTSTEQTTEGANLIGKSVEMLANSIAEMRTYGEGFVIADQAPELLDKSVIRNTNTKIIFRLPDYADRELVGRSANLNDAQIGELGRLKKGVAAVYQNGWIDPILCQFEKFKYDGKVYKKSETNQIDSVTAEEELLSALMDSDFIKNIDENEPFLKEYIKEANLSPELKASIAEYFLSKDEAPEKRDASQVLYEFFMPENAFVAAADAKNIEEWKERVTDSLKPSVKNLDNEELDKLLAVLVQEYCLKKSEYEPIYINFMDYYDKEHKDKVW